MYNDVTENDINNFKTIKDFYKEEYFYKNFDEIKKKFPVAAD